MYALTFSLHHGLNTKCADCELLNILRNNTEVITHFSNWLFFIFKHIIPDLHLSLQKLVQESKTTIAGAVSEATSGQTHNPICPDYWEQFLCCACREAGWRRADATWGCVQDFRAALKYRRVESFTLKWSATNQTGFKHHNSHGPETSGDLIWSCLGFQFQALSTKVDVLRCL